MSAFVGSWTTVCSGRENAVDDIVFDVDVGFKIVAARNLAKSMLTGSALNQYQGTAYI